MLEVCPTYTTT